jgi:penicillin-binding protein 1A
MSSWAGAGAGWNISPLPSRSARDILALVGGYGYRLGGFDRSQRARRQPGSAFKPFIYAAAIDSKRYTAASMVNDSPEVFKLWKPQNHEKNKFRVPVRLRVALADSINTVSIKLLSDIGVLPVRELAVAAGLELPPPEKLDLSLALGTVAMATESPAGRATPLPFDMRGFMGKTLLAVAS